MLRTYCVSLSFFLSLLRFCFFFFFFNDTATTEIYTLSLHDALPISGRGPRGPSASRARPVLRPPAEEPPLDLLDPERDRKSTRLNSSHSQISYAVFCLKKKKNKKEDHDNSKHMPEMHVSKLERICQC